MNITKNLTTVNRTVYSNRPIDYIVIHYFGALGSAASTCAYFKSVNRSASAHYFVDSDGIWQCVEDWNAAWHCGDGGRGKFKGCCLNRNSIGIEVRPYKLNTATASASDADWYFDAATIANLTELVRAKMAEYGIDADHVIRHYDVTAKWCPRPWLGDDINQYYGEPGNQLWAEWKKSLTEDNDMTGKEIYDKLNEYLRSVPCPDAAKAELQEAIDLGITDGGRPLELTPRYQTAIMAKRAVKGKK